MHDNHHSPAAVCALGLTWLLDWFAHHGPALATYLTGAVTVACMIGNLWINYRNSESRRAKDRAEFLRELSARGLGIAKL